MKATHRDYLHPAHLRVMDDGVAYCLAPSHSMHSRLNKSSLPLWEDLSPEERLRLDGQMPPGSYQLCRAQTLWGMK